MPTYNYYCKNCNTHFSYFQKMSESPIKKCKDCKGDVNRVITGGTGLIFKGSGFYLTDYKNKKKDEKEKIKKDNVDQSKKIKNKKNLKQKKEKS